MKAKVFFLIVALAFSPVLCNSSLAGETPEDEKSMDHQLYVMGSKNYILEDDSGPNGYAFTAKLIPPEEFFFTGDDILSYDPTTEEIVFTDSIFGKLQITYPIVNIYVNDTPILESIAINSSFNSRPIYELVFFFNVYDNKFYLCYGYPYSEDHVLPEWVQEKRAAYAEKRKAGWDIFIKYLSDNGKIYTGIKEVKTKLPIRIYSAGKTAYVNNETGKTGIVTVYRIDGLKVMERAMVSQTTTLEILAGGFYLVSVKAGNEKPVTAKVIVR